MRLSVSTKPAPQWLTATLHVFAALCTALAVSVHFGTEQSLKDSMTTTTHLSALAVFGFVFLVGKKVFDDWTDKRGLTIAAVFGLLFGAAEVVGNTLHIADKLEPLFASGALLFKSFVAFVGFAYLGTVCALLAMRFFTKEAVAQKSAEKRATKNSPLLAKLSRVWQSDLGFFLLVWAALILSRLPYFLAFYPGITGHDANNQLMMALGYWKYENHHPITHTLIIQFFTSLSQGLGGSVNTGVALYSFAQILLTTAAFAYALTRMRAWGWGKPLQIVSFMFMTFFPLLGNLSMVMWKDILFGASFLLLIVVLVDLLQQKRAFFGEKKHPQWKNWALLIFSIVATVLTRNNGRYVVVLAMIVLLIVLKPVRKQLAVSAVVAALISAVFLGSVSLALQVKPSPMGEMLSIPLQQFARIAKAHPNDLSEKQVDFLRNLNSGNDPKEPLPTIEEIAERYDPFISDPVKFKMNNDYFNQNKGAFVSNWVTLCLQHPGTAIAAFLNNTYGYWTVIEGEWTYRTVWYTPYIKENSYGLAPDSRFPAFLEFLNAHKDLVTGNTMPVIAQLFSLGLGFWLLMLCAALLLWKKRKDALALLSPLFVLWLTCIASPVNGEYRYFYGIVCALPIVIGYTITRCQSLETRD
ncbi:MAG: DUF6020 family protein [Oscillospiraceae bacterium]|nr:DUF6020 family protein [Oscillospiraceae bacterium]